MIKVLIIWLTGARRTTWRSAKPASPPAGKVEICLSQAPRAASTKRPGRQRIQTTSEDFARYLAEKQRTTP